MKVLHVSDLHLDPSRFFVISYTLDYEYELIRGTGYMTGAEANCTSGLCCRDHVFNSLSPNKTMIPAPRFGAYLWYADVEFLAASCLYS